MNDATSKLTRLQIRISELKTNIVHRAAVKHEVFATNALSLLKTKSENRISLAEEVPVLSIFLKSLACAPLPVEPELEIIEEPKSPFLLFIS